jgi:hypothetical protein
MNISGVGAPAPSPVPAPIAPVAAPSPTDRASTEAAKAAPQQEKGSRATGAEAEAPRVPPLKGLSVNEFRVILGELPIAAEKKLAKQAETNGGFDTYA